MKKIICVGVLVGLLFGCGGDKTNVAVNEYPANGDIEASECSVVENLVKNAEFALNANQVIPEGWGASQHSGEVSFETEISSGVLLITKTATQPWFSFLQTLDAGLYGGRKMRFSADLQLNLNDENLNHTFVAGGGLFLLVYGNPDPVVGGDSLLLDLSLKHEPKLGVTDWQRVSLDFEVPAKATRVVFGFVHKANGSMSASNPVLSVCGGENG